MDQEELEVLYGDHSISKEEALKSCRYYHGEEECPYEEMEGLLWDYERVFVQEAQLGINSEQLLRAFPEYCNSGIDIVDDRHIYLKSILLNRYEHWNDTYDGFVEWYKKWYFETHDVENLVLTINEREKEMIIKEKKFSICRYYHDGENEPPETYDDAQMSIWQSEKTACGFRMFKDDVTTEAFVVMVVNLIAKWCPYDYWEILKVYKTENPEYKDIIEAEERILL